jgi:hypothetical protein
MKKINLLGILFVLISIFGACKKEKRGINFNLYLKQSFIIQNGSPINLPISILLPDVTTNSTAQFEQNDTRAELINSIKLTTLDLHIEDPPSQDFSFLKDVEVFVKAENLPEIRLAYLFNNSSNSQSISLKIEDQDFAEYLKKEQISLRVKTVVHKTFAHQIKFNADMKFRVNASVI